MKEIANIELVLRTLGRWNPGDLAFVESICYESGSDQWGSKLLIVALFQKRDIAKGGWPSSSAPCARVSIEFRDVSNFHVAGLSRTPKQIMGFDIEDVSERGMEGISFIVEDYEAGQIGFTCREIQIMSVESLLALP
ncbi:MAG TPA: hypothetical protein VMT75_12825 [Candidatus Saccharimonadales bacterium]|nr:hypothetical protein [Candidatus Saccharimonadales bacterium]